MVFAAMVAMISANNVYAQYNMGRQSANLPKWEHLADTPQMGWSSWNCFMTDINEELIMKTADAMVELGLVDAGYVYLNLDDGWHGERDANGFIQEDREKFPSGIKALADYLHSKGMKLGIYSDAGDFTCACYSGSHGHEYQDAVTYASWGVDYLKYDWCFTTNIDAKGAYTLMRNALRKAGRPIFFSMCEWGTNKPWEWAAEVGHSWRTTHDIGPAFLPCETNCATAAGCRGGSPRAWATTPSRATLSASMLVQVTGMTQTCSRLATALQLTESSTT